MSHYIETTIRVKSETALIAALTEMGYEPVVAIGEPLPLHGYRGDVRRQVAHVVIPRTQVSPGANDVGFLRGEDGVYVAIISEFDRGAGRCDAAWEGRVAQLAGVHATLEEAARLGYVCERSADEDGRQLVTVYAQ